MRRRRSVGKQPDDNDNKDNDNENNDDENKDNEPSPTRQPLLALYTSLVGQRSMNNRRRQRARVRLHDVRVGLWRVWVRQPSIS
jgi:hypothetical protein